MSRLIYLAGPMTGYPDMNYPAFHKAADELRWAGHTVFNPAENTKPDADIRHCMAMDLTWICLHAEAIALLPGWEKSKGAVAEKALADRLGIDVIYLD